MKQAVLGEPEIRSDQLQNSLSQRAENRANSQIEKTIMELTIVNIVFSVLLRYTRCDINDNRNQKRSRFTSKLSVWRSMAKNGFCAIKNNPNQTRFTSTRKSRLHSRQRITLITQGCRFDP
ncbi:hypothetical protein AVEN_104898-1 [Araneus ventricosus]|uniref:Uncharacterized protein n=1 Tax=Araneus ventricosus TaxID=182803 RepID=A0A4Y2FH58_ARAVE|nr:hypothetical protein AVEN_104898-1 [Araneus ventricosus]